MIVATAGHVDHGKTLLVKTLTGVDTDRLPEEKARGLSIELGYAFHDLGDGEVTGFIDVPGHERFVRTMVAGVSGTDLVLFVIAADDGPMPQTAEHLAILDLLGIARGIIALNKIDRVSEERVAEVTRQIRQLLAGSGLAECRILPVSAQTGAGMAELRAALIALKGEVPARSSSGNFRLAIDRSFVLKGAGRVVTGTVFSGAVAVGDAVYLAPGGSELRVRGVHAQNRETANAGAGQRCALNIAGAGVREGEIRRGDWVVSADAAFGTARLEAEIRLLASEQDTLRSRTPVHVHLGAVETTGRVMLLEANALAPGATALVQLQLDREIHAVRGDRLILRDQSARRTVGGGVIINPLPDARRRKRAERMAILDGMRQSTAVDSLTALLAVCREGVALAPFTKAWNLRADETSRLVEQVALVRYGPADEPVVIDALHWEALSADILSAAAHCHAAEPERLGIGAPELRRALPAPPGAELFKALVQALLSDGSLVREDTLLRLASHTPVRDPRDERLWQRLRPLLEVPENRVPVLQDLLTALGMKPALLEPQLLKFARQGLVVRVSAKRYFLPAMMARFAAQVRELGASRPEGRFSAADFRDSSGVGRNAVIEILEYFDRTGLTRRQGDVRVVLQAKP